MLKDINEVSVKWRLYLPLNLPLLSFCFPFMALNPAPSAPSG